MMSYTKFKLVEGWFERPIEDKTKLAHKTISQALLVSRKPAIAFSGGKNSTVLLHMLLQHDPEILVVYVNTGVEYSKNVKYVRKLAKEWNLNYHELKPDTNFWKVVEKYGFPDHRRWYKKEPKCCYYLKNKPAGKFYEKNGIDCIFTGISASESRTRKITISDRGLIFYAKSMGQYRFKNPVLKVHPLGYWTDEDIWTYFKVNNLPKNPVYEITDRNGCITCTGYITWEKQMARNFPKLYKLVMKKMREQKDPRARNLLSEWGIL